MNEANAAICLCEFSGFQDSAKKSDPADENFSRDVSRRTANRHSIKVRSEIWLHCTRINLQTRKLN